MLSDNFEIGTHTSVVQTFTCAPFISLPYYVTIYSAYFLILHNLSDYYLLTAKDMLLPSNYFIIADIF